MPSLGILEGNPYHVSSSKRTETHSVPDDLEVTNDWNYESGSSGHQLRSPHPSGSSEPEGPTGSSNDDFLWENLDLDWMSKEDEDLFMLLPTTAKTEYQTSVYQQSVTLYVRMKSNNSQPGLLESSLEVGPWSVPKEKLPVLVGSLAGVCLLFLMGVSLALYVCLYKRHPAKDFSVKSEASSVSSGRSERSGRTLSRDSLVLVTGPSSTHQARLLSDPTGANNFFFDYSFDFYFDPPDGGNSRKSNTLKEGCNVHTYGGRRNNNNSESLLQRGFSLRVARLQKEESSALGQRSESGPIISRTDAATKELTQDDAMKLDRKEKQENETSEEKDEDPISDMAQCESAMEKEVDSSDMDLSTPSPQKQDFEHGDDVIAYDRNTLLNETLKTRSLPAWVRSKRSRPLMCNGDLSYSLYGKREDQHFGTKRRRNRMGSDAAQAIALCRSKARLISPGSSLNSSRSRLDSTSRPEAIQDALRKPSDGDPESEAAPKNSPKNRDSHVIVIPSSTDPVFDAITDELRFTEDPLGSIGSGDLEYQNLINDAIIIYNERTSL